MNYFDQMLQDRAYAVIVGDFNLPDMTSNDPKCRDLLNLTAVLNLESQNGKTLDLMFDSCEHI